MTSISRESWASGITDTSTSASTLTADDIDARKLFNGVVAGINFRSALSGASIKIEKNRSVYDIVKGLGPNAILGEGQSQVRWIHLPINCMAWIEDLMEKLADESQAKHSQRNPGEDETLRVSGVLRNDVWKYAFHGKYSAGIHSRFMRPLCERYSSVESDDPESDESDSIHQNANILLLHLPYLHWESYNAWKDRQRHIARMKELALKDERCACLNSTTDIADLEARRYDVLLHDKLFHSRPVHDRRTLDQSYFYNLRKVAYRDEDQVIGMHTRLYELEQRDKTRKMMMVDQLWIWVIDGNTIVTSFPETGTGRAKEANVLQKILDDLKPSLGQGTKSLHGLIALIIDHCIGVFHRSDINPDLAFFEFFADEIGTVKSEVEDMFTSFHRTSSGIEQLWTAPGITTEMMSRELDSLFSIKEEIKVLKRLEKIMSDLHKIDFLCSQQTEVLYKLVKGGRSSRSLTEVFETAKHYRELWSDMADTAQRTRDSLFGLLDLKQRQANVSEARTVRYQVEISAKQGRSIMLLTIITIVFLPLSLFATIFGMNAIELNRGQLPISTISAIMFPISFCIALGALGLAFNETSRELITLFVRRVFNM